MIRISSIGGKVSLPGVIPIFIHRKTFLKKLSDGLGLLETLRVKWMETKGMKAKCEYPNQEHGPTLCIVDVILLGS